MSVCCSARPGGASGGQLGPCPRLFGGAIAAIAFTMDTRHERYAGDIPMEQTVHALATAEGRLGSSYEYLASTVTHLDELGVDDAVPETIEASLQLSEAVLVDVAEGHVCTFNSSSYSTCSAYSGCGA